MMHDSDARQQHDKDREQPGRGLVNVKGFRISGLGFSVLGCRDIPKGGSMGIGQFSGCRVKN